MRRWAVLVVAALAAVPALAAYDDGWYRAPFWPGEYPPGFLVERTQTILVRDRADPDAPRIAECLLVENAVYHPWNFSRVQARDLIFATYSQIVPYVVTAPAEIVLYREDTGAEAVVGLEPGDRWDYLAYQAEGFFTIAYDGLVYTADQSLIEVSEAVEPGTDPSGSEDLWLKLWCENGRRGWILLSEVLGQPGIGDPVITDFGFAEDRR